MAKSRVDRADERAQAWIRVVARAVEAAGDMTKDHAYLYACGLIDGIASANTDLADVAARRSHAVEDVVAHLEREHALTDGEPSDEPAEVAFGVELHIDPDDETVEPTDRELVDLDSLPDPASV